MIDLFLLLYILYLFSYVIIFNKVQNYSKKIQFFGKNNLIVLSFDGISNLKMNKIIQSDEAFKNILKDFKFYKNVTTVFPTSIRSINAELNEKVIVSKHENKKNILNDKNFNTIVYGNPYSLFINNADHAVHWGK